MRSTRSRDVVRAIVVTAGMRLVSALALLLITPRLTAGLGAQDYGAFATLTTSATLLALGDLGVSNYVISRLAPLRWGSTESRRVVSAALGVLAAATGLALVVSVVLALALPWPDWIRVPSTPDETIRIAVVTAFASMSIGLLAGLGQKLDLARQRGHIVALWGAASAVSGPLAALFAVERGWGLPTVVGLATLVPQVPLLIETLAALRALDAERRLGLPAPDPALVREALRAGATFWGLGAVVTVSYGIDTLIVSSVVGVAAAGQFSLVVKVFALVSATFQAAIAQLWASFAEALARGDLTWVRRTFGLATAGGLLVGIVGCLPLVWLGRPLFTWWVGNTFTPSSALLAAAATWTVYQMAVHPMAMLLNGAGMQGRQLQAAVPMLLVNVSLSLLLAHQIGSPGPLIASVAAHAGLVLLPLGVAIARRLRGPAPVTDPDVDLAAERPVR